MELGDQTDFIPQNDFDRMVFFEHARKIAETSYTKNPLDADNLTRWGGALLELSQFQSGNDSLKMVKAGGSIGNQSEEARHAMVLGKCPHFPSVLHPSNDEANIYFAKATRCFQQAVEEEPENELYMKSLDMSSKAPELHLELQRQMAGQQQATLGGSSSNVKAKKKKKDSNLKYDLLGWVILAVAVVAWVGMAKSQLPPPPPAHK